MILFITMKAARGLSPTKATGTSAAEGVAADVLGNIFVAEVGPKRLMRYVRS
jgi:hypothetical protein